MSPAAEPVRGDEPDDAELVETLGATVGAEYHALEVAMIAAVVVEVKAGTGDPLAMFRLQDEGRRLVAGVDPHRLADTTVATATRAGIASVPGAGMTPPLAASATNLSRELANTLARLGPPMAAWMPHAYTQAGVLLGSTQDDAAIIASRYLARGIPGKRYANGAWMPIGSYAEMVARTYSHEAQVVARTESMVAAGLPFASIVTAADACPTCAQNRGKIWSLDGRPAGSYTVPIEGGGTRVVVVAGPIAAASRGTHFRGPNCRCQVVNYTPGTGVVTGPKHDPKAEKDRDRQRALERDIRRWKYRQMTALDPTEAENARRHVRAAQGRMRDFLNNTGRARRPYRESTTWASGPRPSAVAPIPVEP